MTFDEANEDRLLVDIDGATLPVIGRRALIRNKRASGRPKDLGDVEALTRTER